MSEAGGLEYGSKGSCLSATIHTRLASDAVFAMMETVLILATIARRNIADYRITRLVTDVALQVLDLYAEQLGRSAVIDNLVEMLMQRVKDTVESSQVAWSVLGMCDMLVAGSHGGGEADGKVADEEFYCVFDTLDGHTARSEGGIATLKAVGDLIRDHPKTFVIYDAIGLDMDEHYARTLGISKERLILAASMLAHQPTKSITVPETADASLVAQADMLYSYTSDYRGLTVVNTQPNLVKAISAIYDQHSNVRIRVVPGFIGSAGMMLILLHSK